jgi:hypothetical protein
LHNRRQTAKLLWGGLWRLATAASVGYLVFDRLYETSATISVPASDPRDPFMFPFVISNSSHLFALHNIRWLCDIDDLAVNGKRIIGARVGLLAQEPPHDIPPGAVLNASCRDRVKMPAGRITTLTVDIELAYDVDIALWTWNKHPPPAYFHWYPDASNPQWIRGDITH